MSLATEPTLVTTAEAPQPVLSSRLALKWRHAAACTWFAALFLYLSYIPVFHSDIWGHVAYGHWILEHRALPAEDPMMPLAAGMRVVDNAWLAQVIYAAVEGWGGATGLSILFAVIGLATYLIYTRVFYRLSGSIGIALLAMALTFLVGFTRHAIIRPENFGALAFALLVWMLTPSLPRWLWFAVPALFLLWANLHGSFAVGLITLACHAIGRGIDVALRRCSVLAPLADDWFRRLVFLTELAFAATLVNPYGLDLLINTARFGSNPNLRDVLEWYPLRLMDMEGIGLAASVVILFFVLRHSRRPVHAVEVLLLLVLVALMAPTVRMIGWYAPAFSLVLTPHLADLWNRRKSRAAANDSSTSAATLGSHPNFFPTLLCGLTIWVAFALTPLSQPLLGGKPRAKEKLYSKHTPHALTQYLREHPPRGLVFGPQWWGDWLAWSGPPGIQVFMTTNLHLAPQQVWRDYLQVARGQSGWEQILDRYNVGTLVVHKELQPGMARQIRRSAHWRVAYEDALGVVAERMP